MVTRLLEQGALRMERLSRQEAESISIPEKIDLRLPHSPAVR